jgi:CDP-paratose 2-epimerase
MRWEYVEQPRVGDHICYISDLGKMKRHYPEWSVTRSLDEIFEELVDAWNERLGARPGLGETDALVSAAGDVAKLPSGG